MNFHSISPQKAMEYLKDTEKNKAGDITNDVRKIRMQNMGDNITLVGQTSPVSADDVKNCCEMSYLIINEKCREKVSLLLRGYSHDH
jgi:hypothetical protein